MLAGNLASAGTLKCDGGGVGFAVPIGGESLKFGCSDENGKSYNLELMGLAVGAGAEFDKGNVKAMVSCPFKSNYDGVYSGLKATFVIGNFSLNPNIFLGAGVCTVDIDSLGIGVIVTIGKIRIY